MSDFDLYSAANGTFARRGRLVVLCVLALAVVAVLLRFAELGRLWVLLRQIDAGWLIAATLVQGGALACIPLVWWTVLRRGGVRVPFGHVFPLAFAKVFVDRVVPSGGISGSAAAVAGLERRGVAQPLALAAILADFIAYFLGFAGAVLLALLTLWRSVLPSKLVLALCLPFLLVALLVPGIILRLLSPRPGFLLRRLGRWKAVTRFLQTFQAAPRALVVAPGSLLPGALFRFLVFVFNAATLWALLRALGHPATLGPAFVAVVVGALATTLGPFPGGVGAYEPGAVGVLILSGIPNEEAVAAVLLLRGLTFWAPILPGFFVVKRALGPTGASAKPQSDNLAESNSTPVASMACTVMVPPSTTTYRK